MHTEQTIAAIATPPGNGGIAIIRLSGPDSFAIASRLFNPINPNKSVLNAPGYTALFGTYIWEGRLLDEGVLLCFRAPHSYTGEDVVELSCHGGAEISREILQACQLAGAAPAAPGEFTKRALLNGRMSLTQAEAVMDLISAHSRQGAAAARAALSGSIQKEIENHKQSLIRVAGHLSATMDYPEEDVEELQISQMLEAIGFVRNALESLIANYDRGMLLKRGVRAVIAGSPNVGKSTLFNLISGFERTIVTPVAGTTRDVVREEVVIAGIPLQLSDTAGLHETQDSIEAEGIRRSYEEMEQAGLIIAVFDGSCPIGEKEWELAEHCKGKPSLAVINKSDLGTVINSVQLFPFFEKVIVVSAKSEDARDKLECAVAEILRANEINTDAALLANERQLSSAIFARDALLQGEAALVSGLTMDAAGVCIDDALHALADLTGENISEAVINDVFSRFCVGK